MAGRPSKTLLMLALSEPVGTGSYWKGSDSGEWKQNVGAGVGVLKVFSHLALG